MLITDQCLIHCSKMEEADLFMECEEEELEPWQQINQDEPHNLPDSAESMAFALNFRISYLLYWNYKLFLLLYVGFFKKA